jgi:hypothetical protein
MRCPNCGTEHEGKFCHACGQSNVDLHLPLGALASEAVEETLGFDSRLRHTLVPFFLRPGEVIREYLAGHRARYTSPLKLYIIAAAIFFFAFDRSQPQVVNVDAQDWSASDAAHEGRLEHFFRERGKKLAAMGQEQAAAVMKRSMAATLPKAFILLLPAFALLLKLFWRRRYFAEHLVFALYFHAFALIVLTPGGLVRGAASTALNTAAFFICAIYFYVALRRVYGDSKLRTLAKFAGLGLAYLVLVSFALAGAGVASLASV